MSRRKTYDLSSLGKRLETLTPEALDFLSTTMKNTEAKDEARIQCAKKIIDASLQVSEMLARIKMNEEIMKFRALGSNRSSMNGDGKSSSPILDFTTVKEIT